MKDFNDICKDDIIDYAPEKRHDYRADFSLNENPLGCSTQVLDSLRDIETDKLTRYQPIKTDLVEKIAEFENVGKDQIVISAGSDKCLQSVGMALFSEGDTVGFPSPSFPRYEFYGKLMGAKSKGLSYPVFEGRDSQQILSRAEELDFLIIDNPGNPTGHRFSEEELIEIRDEFDSHLILDCALSGDSINSELLNEQVFVVKSFSKYFGLPGLRLGYIVSDKQNASKLKSVISPFEITSFAQEAAIAALDDIDHIEKSRKYIKKQRNELKTGLEELNIAYTDSESTNMVIELSEEKQDLLKEKGINFTPGKKFKGLPEDTIRIGIRKKEENELLLKILNQIT